MADTTIKPVAQQPVAVEPAIVIGAGAAGLAAAHALIKAGVPTAILEKESRLAEPWHRRHLNLHLNTHRDLSSLPGVGFPAGTPAFPPRTLVIRHLNEFSETHGLPVQFGVAVEEIAFKGDHWAVLTSAGPRLARHVVIATGRDRQPFVPQWKGMKDFAGRIIHSADFGDAKDYAGKKVLVVGAGNSGFDALNHLANVDTAAVWLSARNGPALLPKRIGKIAVHRLSPLMARLPLRLADAAIAATQRLVFGDLTKFGMPPAPSGGVSAPGLGLYRDRRRRWRRQRHQVGPDRRGAGNTGIHPRRRDTGQWQPDRSRHRHCRDRLPHRAGAHGRQAGGARRQGLSAFQWRRKRSEIARPLVHRHAAKHPRLLRQFRHHGKSDRQADCQFRWRLPPSRRFTLIWFEAPEPTVRAPVDLEIRLAAHGSMQARTARIDLFPA